MNSIHPLGEPEVVKLQFQFTVSADWIEEQLQETGMQMPEDWEVEFELPDVPGDLRGHLVRAHRQYLELPGYPDLYAPVDDPQQFLEAISNWIKSESQELEREEAQTSARTVAEKDQGQQFERERKSWIAEHGSPRLRLADERRYKVNRTYAVERAAVEYPRFWVDTSGDSDVRERTDPSMEALELEQAVKTWVSHQNLDVDGVDPRIIWLAAPPKELDEYVDENDWLFEQQEAILVPEFLGRYSLVLPVDEDLHRPVEGGAE